MMEGGEFLPWQGSGARNAYDEVGLRRAEEAAREGRGRAEAAGAAGAVLVGRTRPQDDSQDLAAALDADDSDSQDLSMSMGDHDGSFSPLSPVRLSFLFVSFFFFFLNSSSSQLATDMDDDGFD